MSVSNETIASATALLQAWKCRGRVTGFRQGLIRASVPVPALGDIYLVRCRNGVKIPTCLAATEGAEVLLSPFGDIAGVYLGAAVEGAGRRLSIEIPRNPLGQIFGSLGESLNPMAVVKEKVSLPVFRDPPDFNERRGFCNVLSTGIGSIDTFCTLAEGQRVGLFAEAGMGKTTLLGTMAKSADVDAIVVALVGERGREVTEFIHGNLGSEGLKKSVVVVATSDESSSRRMLVPYTATTISEYLREQGMRVLLVCDSLTRMARAQRELALALGELPTHRGFPVTVFAELPRLLERAGATSKGSITSVYTVLTESERVDTDPLAEELKSLLDGHIVLSRDVAEQGIRPAVDVMRSLSRSFHTITTDSHKAAAATIRRAIMRLGKDRELATLAGRMDDEYMLFRHHEEKISNFLSQECGQSVAFRDSQKTMLELADILKTDSGLK